MAKVTGLPEFEDLHTKRKWMLNHMAAAFRMFGRNGYNEGTAGHVTVRDPIDENTFWINPLEVPFSLMKPSDLVHINSDGEIIGGSKMKYNTSGFAIHYEMHKVRPEVICVCHVHSIYGKAFSALGKPLDMLNTDCCVFYNNHGIYFDMDDVISMPEEGRRTAKGLADYKAVLVQNHGIMTVGTTVDEAAYLLSLMERSCQIQLLIDSATKVGERKHVHPTRAKAIRENADNPVGLYTAQQPNFLYEVACSNGELEII
ncbi:adducin, involved in actin cytoskeleton organization [Schizosaccharomyces pombe]|uniref:Meiotically up-regulated gene 14 protein n=1 Tax=Schizosaccharomyces pombe (strain 972 / ATCC 24843) TaxID=284812 RepID=MUG14_SCHPO|nr:adducin [Schizosaccharomyces pombe]Q9P5M9.1 RecName: Full=Meiotically up-regulated gene 14 protein [Schizosaccharomyces pombe 972h-]CAB91575.1 adducin [Schizosaccharomyces pombe]|eukprot:NP_595056.1 adducin [Schizosaccharomyces pombe]